MASPSALLGLGRAASAPRSQSGATRGAMRGLAALTRARRGLSELLPPRARGLAQVRALRPRDAAVAPYAAAGPGDVYPKRKSPFKRCKALIDALHAEEAARLVASGRAVMPAKVPGLRSGDVVRVAYVASAAQEKAQYFTGMCIAVKRRGLGSSFVLRNVVDGVAVERAWPTYSPLIRDAEVLGRNKVRRNKLWYLRDKPLRESTFGNALRRPAAERKQ